MSCRVRGDWFAVPCQGSRFTASTLLKKKPPNNNNNQERALARRRGFEEISQTQATILRSQQGGGLLHSNEDYSWCFPCQLFFLVSHFIIAKVVNDIRKTLSGAILDPEDKIKDVLDDNDFVSIVLETDRPNPSLEQAEVSLM